MYNNSYNGKVKTEYINTINRITSAEHHIKQLYRTMDWYLLYNYLHDEIIYLGKQQTYFNNIFDKEIAPVFDDYLEKRIKLYNHYIGKL